MRLKRRQDRLWPPGNTDGATISRRGIGDRLLVALSIVLLGFIGGVGAYMFYVEEVRAPPNRGRNQIASAQGAFDGEPARERVQTGTLRAPARDAFGSLPKELDANVSADEGRDTPSPPRETAALQPSQQEQAIQEPAHLEAAPGEANATAKRDALEAGRRAAIAQEPAAQAETQSAPDEQAVAPPSPSRPKLSAELVATLRNRAEEAMARNDIIAARLLLERAAAGGDAQALEDLARTYDPVVLGRMGLSGIIPGDEQKAARLYKEAQQARASARAN